MNLKEIKNQQKTVDKYMEKTDKNYHKSALIILLLIICGSIFVLKHQDITDWYRLRNYSPPANIQSLANNTSMTPYGKKLFYVHKPQLEDKETFRRFCTDTEKTIVLGCYISNQSIHLYDVEDDRLSGIEEVTSAHEMLHAAYDRLSKDEKTKLNKMLENQYSKITDQRILETIDQYREQDPNIVNNELHSIIGTEIREISSELENYYGRYFNDRLAIVNYSEKYESEFNKPRVAVENYDKELAKKKVAIDDLETVVNSLGNQLDREKTNLEYLKDAGRIEEYNSSVDEYNSMVRSYNTQVNTLKNLKTDYNRVVEIRNSLIDVQQTLIDSIDTRVPSAR